MLIKEELVKGNTGFTDDSGMEFAPFQKVANKIDDCLSLIGYYKFFGNIANAIKKEEELKELREEVMRIKRKVLR